MQHRVPLGAADRLRLAAAPTFALMALLTAALGESHAAMICSSSQQAASVTGMAPMYLLMSIFHLPPWLRLISPRQLR